MKNTSKKYDTVCDVNIYLLFKQHWRYVSAKIWYAQQINLLQQIPGQCMVDVTKHFLSFKSSSNLMYKLCVSIVNSNSICSLYQIHIHFNKRTEISSISATLFYYCAIQTA